MSILEVTSMASVQLRRVVPPLLRSSSIHPDTPAWFALTTRSVAAGGAVRSGTILLTMTATGSHRALGRSPDDLTLDERLKLAGKYIAMEIYTPAVLPMRRIEAIGDSL